MVQQVDVDGAIHEFPDEATPEMIQSALKNEAARQQFSNIVLNSPGEKLKSDIWSAAKNLAGTATQGGAATINQLLTDPARAQKNIEAGLVGMFTNTGNAVLNLPQYLAHLESDPVSDFIKKHTPQIPTEAIENKRAGFAPTQSDAAIRNMISNLPILFPIGKAGLGATADTVTGGVSSIVGKTDPALEASEAALQANLPSKVADVEQKTAAAQAADEANKQAIAQSKQTVGKSDADLMQYNVDQRQKNIDNLTAESANLQQQLADIKPEETDLPTAEENLSRSQDNLQNAQAVGADIDSNVSQYLNQGAQHDVRAAQGLSNRVQDIEDYWNDAYKTFQNNIADANFQMPSTAMDKLDYDKMSPAQLIQNFGADAFEALKKGKMDDFIQKQKANEAKEAANNNPYLQDLTEVAPTADDTNAADFLAKYKDFRDRLSSLKRDKADPRTENIERQKMSAAIDSGSDMFSQMKDVLNAGLGEYKPEFDRLNKGYSEQIYPLRENPVVQNAQEGKLSDNIIKSLRTNQEGMPLVRELVKQDPELLRNVVGQRYFAKPNEIYNPNEMIREYLDEMPELKQLLAQREQSNQELEQAKNNVDLAQQHHKAVSARQADAIKMQSKIDSMQADIDAHQQEISKLKENIDNLQKTAQQKNITLREKVQAEKELKDMRKQLKETSAQLDDKVTGLKKVWRVAKTIYKIKSGKIFY